MLPHQEADQRLSREEPLVDVRICHLGIKKGLVQSVQPTATLDRMPGELMAWSRASTSES